VLSISKGFRTSDDLYEKMKNVKGDIYNCGRVRISSPHTFNLISRAVRAFILCYGYITDLLARTYATSKLSRMVFSDGLELS
jgi:hypothetical protein